MLFFFLLSFVYSLDRITFPSYSRNWGVTWWQITQDILNTTVFPPQVTRKNRDVLRIYKGASYTRQLPFCTPSANSSLSLHNSSCNRTSWMLTPWASYRNISTKLENREKIYHVLSLLTYLAIAMSWFQMKQCQLHMDVWLFMSNGVWRTADAMMVQGMGQSQDRCLT